MLYTLFTHICFIVTYIDNQAEDVPLSVLGHHELSRFQFQLTIAASFGHATPTYRFLKTHIFPEIRKKVPVVPRQYANNVTLIVEQRFECLQPVEHGIREQAFVYNDDIIVMGETEIHQYMQTFTLS